MKTASAALVCGKVGSIMQDKHSAVKFFFLRQKQHEKTSEGTLTQLVAVITSPAACLVTAGLSVNPPKHLVVLGWQMSPGELFSFLCKHDISSMKDDSLNVKPEGADCCDKEGVSLITTCLLYLF